jgi:hypothetical protein
MRRALGHFLFTKSVQYDFGLIFLNYLGDVNLYCAEAPNAELLIVGKY